MLRTGSQNESGGACESTNEGNSVFLSILLTLRRLRALARHRVERVIDGPTNRCGRGMSRAHELLTAEFGGHELA